MPIHAHTKDTSQDTSVMLFKIPNIDNLFLFRESMDNAKVMAAIIAELLREDHPEILYMGYLTDRAYNYDVFRDGNKNCAVICITIAGKKIIRDNASVSIPLFIEELEKPKNTVQVRSKVLNEAKNISSIAIVIKPGK